MDGFVCAGSVICVIPLLRRAMGFRQDRYDVVKTPIKALFRTRVNNKRTQHARVAQHNDLNKL